MERKLCRIFLKTSSFWKQNSVSNFHYKFHVFWSEPQCRIFMKISSNWKQNSESNIQKNPSFWMINIVSNFHKITSSCKQDTLLNFHENMKTSIFWKDCYILIKYQGFGNRTEWLILVKKSSSWKVIVSIKTWRKNWAFKC